MTWFTRPALLIGAGVVIAKLLVTGQLHYYLTPSFDGLTALTALAKIAVPKLRKAG